VRQRTTQILSIHNLLARNLAKSVKGDDIKRLKDGEIDALALLEDQKRALRANVAVMRCLEEQIRLLEGAILAKGKLRQEFHGLKTVSGIGDVLALTIALETGDVHRFASAGKFASYARMVDSRRESNGKTKGVGNRKCGNKHLSWAFIEAAHYAVRYDPSVRRFTSASAPRSVRRGDQGGRAQARASVLSHHARRRPVRRHAGLCMNRS